MIRKLTTTAAIIGLALSFPALAAHCPKDAKAIDAALERSTLGKDEQAQIKALRDDGMKLHGAGDHRASEGKLAEAMRMLLGGGLK
jgi:hypothetical protein